MDLAVQYPEKVVPIERMFSRIHRGDRVFIGTGCGEPQALVKALGDYVRVRPKAFFDVEVLHVWTLGVAPYTDEKLKDNFRHNSFFISGNARQAVNQGLADYTPIFLSQVPDLIRRGDLGINVALIQTSPPNELGYLNLGVSVDIVKAAVEKAPLVIAQVNSFMPRVHGDGFLHIQDVDYLFPCDEPLLEYKPEADSEIARRIGGYVARLVRDGDTIQVGYGSIPNAVLAALKDKKHLGVHTELLSDGIVDLMQSGVVDNSRKTLHRGKTIAAFCMGSRSTYDYIHDNPAVEFRTIDYTNDLLVISRLENMVAINSALEMDLTGQASAESIGSFFYSGIGGQADFMRGAVLSKHGRAILCLPSTAQGGKVSRIVPFLKQGAGVTLNRGDVHYIVTEYGIAYLHGKNIRDRAMALISVAHPDFRSELVEEAKRSKLIYSDQVFIPGERGEYPEQLETYRTTKKGLDIFIRPVRICDEPLLKDFFYSLSDQSLYTRFISLRKDMPHQELQKFTVVDYTREMVLLAVLREGERERVIGIGQFGLNEADHTAETAFVVADEYQGKGVATELLDCLIRIARRRGLLGLTAEALKENAPMIRVFLNAGFSIVNSTSDVHEFKLEL